MPVKEAGMSIELTVDQRLAIASGSESPPRVVDPDTNTTYVLLRADAYERLQGLVHGEFQPSQAYPAIDRAFAEGWEDPAMSDYDHYEERRKQ
jgi:hypothetical protein